MSVLGIDIGSVALSVVEMSARGEITREAYACLQVLREENNDLIIPYLPYARLRSHPPPDLQQLKTSARR